MEYLFNHWEKIKGEIENKFLLLCLDYDGTLTPIANTPQEALLPAGNRNLIETLSKLNDCRVAIISGRALQNVRKLVGLKSLIYVGNHGFEIDGPDLRFKSLISPQFKENLEELQMALEKGLSGFSGVLFENKGVTVSIHYRLVKEEEMGLIIKTIKKICSPLEKLNQIKLQSGKMVCEIRPPIEWDKGKAVLWLLRKEELNLHSQDILPIYVGDDTTDEDAFKALKDKGISVWVGPALQQSPADYYLHDPKDVMEFLKKIVNLKQNLKAHH